MVVIWRNTNSKTQQNQSPLSAKRSLAQLVAHPLDVREVTSSSLVSSTKTNGHPEGVAVLFCRVEQRKQAGIKDFVGKGFAETSAEILESPAASSATNPNRKVRIFCFIALRQAKSAENPSPPVLPGRGRSHQGMAPYGGDGGSCSGTKAVRKGRERSFDLPRWGKARNVARFPRVGMLAQDDSGGG